MGNITKVKVETIEGINNYLLFMTSDIQTKNCNKQPKDHGNTWTKSGQIFMKFSP